MGDGYITHHKGRIDGLRIRLSEEDYSHLDKLNKCLEYNKPLLIVKNHGVYSNQKKLVEFSIVCRKMALDLTKNGIIPNKSCNEQMPDFNSSDYIKNFILGLFDADGSSSHWRNNKGTFHAEWQIVSGLNILHSIKGFINQFLPNITFNIHENNKGTDNGLYRLKTSSLNSISELYDFFYLNNNNKLYLERKHLKMKQINEYWKERNVAVLDETD